MAGKVRKPPSTGKQRCYRALPAGLLAAGSLLLAGCPAGRSPSTEASGLPGVSLNTLRGTWLLVPEASQADTLAYRRNTYRFRYRPGGRPGFLLGPNGRFLRYDLAPGGGLLAREGSWAPAGSGRLRIQLAKADTVPEPAYTLQLLNYRNEILKLRRQPAP